MFRISPVSSIRSFEVDRAAFRSEREEGTAATYAVAALSAWHQGLISCVAYADCCEDIADWLREHAAERRLVA